MSDFDLSALPDLLARLDDGARVEPDPNTDIGGLRECCFEAVAAIRTLMAEARASGVRLADLSKSEIEIAVAAEREACAQKCRDRADFNLREAKSTGRTMFVDRYQESLECEAAIRARGDA